MNNNIAATRIYLIRHATPDWDRTDIPYNVPPGPPLTQQGEMEASELGVFIRKKGIKKLFYSPLERARRTAEICAKVAGIPIQEELDIAEWRNKENDRKFAARFLPVWDRAVIESRVQGPVGLVTHGAPVRFMLHFLGLDTEVLYTYLKQFGNGNPLPPAGVWLAEKNDPEEHWNLNLVYIPNTSRTLF